MGGIGFKLNQPEGKTRVKLFTGYKYLLCIYILGFRKSIAITQMPRNRQRFLSAGSAPAWKGRGANESGTRG